MISLLSNFLDKYNILMYNYCVSIKTGELAFLRRCAEVFFRREM